MRWHFNRHVVREWSITFTPVGDRRQWGREHNVFGSDPSLPCPRPPCLVGLDLAWILHSEYISFFQDVSPANVRSIATPSPSCLQGRQQHRRAYAVSCCFQFPMIKPMHAYMSANCLLAISAGRSSAGDADAEKR